MVFVLLRSMRLVCARDYQRVFRTGTRIRGPGCIVVVAENGEERSRLGLAVARKHVAKATGRNRIKRVIRESFRQHQCVLSGLDIVVVGRQGLSDISNAALFASLQTQWKLVARRFGRLCAGS